MMINFLIERNSLGNQDPRETTSQLNKNPIKVWPPVDDGHDEQIDCGVGLSGRQFREARLDQAEQRLHTRTI